MVSKRALRLIIYQMANKNFYRNIEGTITTESALIMPIIFIIVYILIEFSIILYSMVSKEAIIYRAMERASVDIAYDQTLKGLYIFDYDNRINKILKIKEELVTDLDEEENGDIIIDEILITSTKISGYISLQSRLGILMNIGNKQVEIDKDIYNPSSTIRDIELLQDYSERYTNISEFTRELFEYIDKFTGIGE